MRKLFIIVMVILLLTTTVSAASITRTTDTKIDGKLDYHLVMSNDEAVTATKLQGEGVMEYTHDVLLKETELAFKQDYILIADDTRSVTGRAYKDIDLVTAVKAEDNVYAVGLKVFGGQKGVFEADYFYGALELVDVEIDVFDVTTYTEVTEGVYRRFVDLTADEISLTEVMRAVGQGVYKDTIRFKPEPPLVE